MNTAREVMIRLRDVHVSYVSGRGHFDDGQHNVLKGVDLEVYEGETLGIIGRNGCGKSTILMIMAGTIGPNRGEVYQLPDKSASLLTLGLGFKPNLSGRDNAILSAMLQGATLTQARSMLEDIREFSELGDSFDEPVKTYSSGMQSRLGFSIAIMNHVDVLLIDETLSVGDAHFRAKAEAAIQERMMGEQTVVFVSHADAQVKSLCDRAIWIDQGVIAAEGETGLVLDQYNQHLTAARKPA